MATSYSRQRALLAALLLFSIGSLLTISLHPSFSIDQDQSWIPTRSRKPWVTTNEDSLSPSSSNSPSTTGDSSSVVDEPATGNNVKVMPDPNISKLPSIAWLKEHLKGSFLDPAHLDEDLEDLMRPVRGKAALEHESRLQFADDDEANSDDDVNDNDTGGDDDEPKDLENDGITNDTSSELSSQAPVDELEQDATIESDDTTTTTSEGSEEGDDEDELDDETKEQREKEVMDQVEGDDELAGDGDDSGETEVTDVQPDGDETADDEDDPLGNTDDDEAGGLDGDDESEDETEDEQVSRDRSLADFDLHGDLATDQSYMLFIPSGDTIEEQFSSLITSLWIARHSNRTLLVPPPIMPSPLLQPLLAPDYVAQKSRLVWNSYYDLRSIANAQRIRFLDSVRHRLTLAFTDDMLQEEADPVTLHQVIPDQVKEMQMPWTPIRCHGPPTAGSWKALDFSGRHFLNSYGLHADFQILGDKYWDLTPEAIYKHWRYIPTEPAPASSTEGGNNVVDDRKVDHHQQLICISGAELVGLEDPAMEERIWEEIGAHVRFSKTTRDKALVGIQRALRALERSDRMHGFISVHFDKMPPQEVCNPGSSSSLNEDNDATRSALTLAAASSMHVQCRWTVELVSRRIAMLQQEEGKPRPVVVTTTETDPYILSQIDSQPGWMRIEHGVDDDEGAAGLFVPMGMPSTDNNNNNDAVAMSAGYAHQVSRASVHAAAAIFVGNRHSSHDVHVAFRIKYEGRQKANPPRWELYDLL